MTKKILTQSRLKETLHYDPDTGSFKWACSHAGYTKGTCAGSPTSTGYVRIMIGRVEYMAHRLAVLYMTGQFPKDVTDHINHIRNDNRWDNLRSVTHAENCRNIRGADDRVYGVTFVKRLGRWRVRIFMGGKSHSYGSYSDKDEAIRVSKSAYKELGFHKNHGI